MPFWLNTSTLILLRMCVIPRGLCTIPLLFFLLLASEFENADSARILSLNFVATKSHKITYEKLLVALAERGHDVTVVGPFVSGKKIKNLREIQTLDPTIVEKEMSGSGNPFELRSLAKSEILSVFFNPFGFLGHAFEKICRQSYELPAVKEILNGKYDLIFFPSFFNECLYGLIHKLNTTTVLFQQVSTMPWIAANLGTPSPPSFVPLVFQGFTDKMTYGERLLNFASTVYNWAVLRFFYNPRMERLYREYLNDPTLPSIVEIEKNSSIVLAYSHVSITRPRPLMPDIIDVGGLNMEPAKPVPKDLDEFIAGAGQHGFILFSMGSALKGSKMPESYRKMFLNVFSKLKQRVLWKWETETMADLPANVKLSKWLPQTDLLGDKRCRLFITHGGHGSTTEAVYHGVPLIGIPMFGDQPANMKKASSLGFALSLEFTDLTEEILLDAVNSILNQPTYSQNAKRLAAIYNDQIDKPLDRAIYWIEYVIRHQGATHLRSAARDLNFYQYYSLDVIATFVVAGLVALVINFIIFRALLRRCWVSKATTKTSKKTQ